MRSSLLFIIAAVAIFSGLISPANAATYTDVPSDRWFSQYIDYLSQNQIIAGYPDNTFRPMQNVTRAEFAAILAKSQTLTIAPSDNRFADVPASHWAAPVISAVAQRGWIAGYPDGTFKPNQTISTAEMYAIAAKLVPGGILPRNEARQALQSFSDRDNIPSWAVRPIGTVVKQGIFVSEVTPNTIDPHFGATRADVATVIAKLENETFRVAGSPTSPLPDDTIGGGTDPDDTEVGVEPTEPMRITGRLHPTVEAGGWLVETRQGEQYLLIGDVRERPWFAEGARVEVSGTPRPDRPNMYMQGIPFEVEQIRRLAGRQDQTF